MDMLMRGAEGTQLQVRRDVLVDGRLAFWVGQTERKAWNQAEEGSEQESPPCGGYSEKLLSWGSGVWAW